MKTKAEKQELYARLKDVFETNPVIVLCGFQGIKVGEDFELRSKIRQAGAGYQVISNRLARLASEGTPAGEALSRLKGMTSMVYAGDDPVGLMKALLAIQKDVEVFEVRSGIVEGQRLDAAALEQLSKMPGKAETQAKLLFLLNAPAQNLLRQMNAPAQHMVGVLNAPARDLVSVLKQAVDQKKFSE